MKAAWIFPPVHKREHKQGSQPTEKKETKYLQKSSGKMFLLTGLAFFLFLTVKSQSLIRVGMFLET